MDLCRRSTVILHDIPVNHIALVPRAVVHAISADH